MFVDRKTILSACYFFLTYRSIVNAISVKIPTGYFMNIDNDSKAYMEK